jgi:ABC-type amino acid transport substrate-binding protein
MKSMFCKAKAPLLVLAGVALFTLGQFSMTANQPAGQAQAAPQTEKAFERVMRTGVLRCGYVVLPPQLNRDPNTGAMSGVAYDIVTEAARRLNLKVEWTEEVTFATMGEGIKSGRYDAFCLTTYRWAPMARVFDYTDTLFFSTVDAYVRADDQRFDTNLQAIDDARITVATIDGEGGEVIRAEKFPQAKTLSMGQSTPVAEMFEAVASGKADITFANPLMVMPYLANKPGVLKRVTGHLPLRSYAHALAFGKGEAELVSTFNIALDEMRNGGVIDQILDKHEKIPNSFLRLKSDVARNMIGQSAR